MDKFLFVLMFLVSLCSSTSHVEVSSGPTQDEHDLSELVKGMEEFDATFMNLESFFVDFDITAEQLIRSSDSTSYMDLGYRLALKENNWSCFTKPSDAPLRVPYDQTFVANSKENVEFEQVAIDSGILSLHEQGLNSNVYSRWYYTDNLFLDIYRNLPKKTSPSYKRLLKANNPCDDPLSYLYLPAAVRSNKNYVFGGNETIGGINCSILEIPDRDKIWIAPSLGYVCVKREMYFGSSRPKRTLWRVVTNSDFRQVGDRIKLPHKQVIIDYPDPKFEKKEIWGKPGCKRVLVVNEIRVGDLSDDFFVPKIKEGLLVRDGINELEYVIRDPDDAPFEKLVDGLAGGAKRHSPWFVINIVVAVILSTVAIFLFLRSSPWRS